MEKMMDFVQTISFAVESAPLTFNANDSHLQLKLTAVIIYRMISRLAWYDADALSESSLFKIEKEV